MTSKTHIYSAPDGYILTCTATVSGGVRCVATAGGKTNDWTDHKGALPVAVTGNALAALVKAGRNPADYLGSCGYVIRAAAVVAYKAARADGASSRADGAKAWAASQAAERASNRRTGWCNRCQSYCYGDCTASR